MNPLTDAGAELVRQIKEEFEIKGLNDTGAASDSISFEVDGDVITILGLERTLFLQYGRRAGVEPPFSAIRDWVERKLNTPEEERDSVAWAIVKKIGKEGTSILKDQAKGLELELLLADILDKYSQIYLSFKAESIVTGLLKTWKS